ncbi:MAG TPA: alpha/beta fold hydrolase, partial [Opitutales bacterium]|nr:alpha/beta fold hydrolase [Opitutales bacterium]
MFIPKFGRLGARAVISFVLFANHFVAVARPSGEESLTSLALWATTGQWAEARQVPNATAPITDDDAVTEQSPEVVFEETVATQHYFRTPDGLGLRYAYFPTPYAANFEPPLTVVFVPGYRLPIETFRSFIIQLLHFGVDVWIFDFAGQGGSETPADSTGIYERHLTHLVYFIEHIVPAQRIILGGFSMGGAIVLRHAQGILAERIVGVMVFAPTTFWRESYTVRDPRNLPWLGQSRLFSASFDDLACLPNSLGEMPLFWATPTEDRLIDSARNEALCRRLGGELVRHHHYACGHNILTDDESAINEARVQLFENLLAWLNETFPNTHNNSTL